MSSKFLVRGALLIALAVILQSLRLVLPLPQFLSTFFIGTLVHMMLVLTWQYAGLVPTMLLSLILPMTAYLEGQLLLAFLIPIVCLGNLLFVLSLRFFIQRKFFSLFIPPLAKAAVMLLAAWSVANFMQLEDPVTRKTIFIAMSIPQFITGFAGIILARQMHNILN